ncbi:hypothetical protein F511_15430 [Dorcoceras hygrometricum]|uniref:Uncharacterized protein n=1 Tax=Dorcoceras hygrometricum TaxID=472368 RepID=A0A2Z7CK53_9LAMI|nr:hypothetical protein F511_15430 [Dorcoceras hygrometricum]
MFTGMDLGESVALHPLKVSNVKSVHTNKMKNAYAVSEFVEAKLKIGDNEKMVAKNNLKAHEFKEQLSWCAKYTSATNGISVDMLSFKDCMLTRLTTLVKDLSDIMEEVSGGLAALSSQIAEFLACLNGDDAKNVEIDWAVKMRIRPPEFETSICDVKYHVSLENDDRLPLKCRFPHEIGRSQVPRRQQVGSGSAAAPTEKPQIPQSPRFYAGGSSSGKKNFFKGKGKQFKRSGTGSSSSSSESKQLRAGQKSDVYCTKCGGRHITEQCIGVFGICRIYNQPGHFVRICPQRGSGSSQNTGTSRSIPPPERQASSVHSFQPQYKLLLQCLQSKIHLAAILDSNKFTGLNYQDWLRNLKIVLASEKLLYTLEKTPPKEAPADASPEELAKLDKWWCQASCSKQNKNTKTHAEAIKKRVKFSLLS